MQVTRGMKALLFFFFLLFLPVSYLLSPLLILYFTVVYGDS